MLVGVTGVFGVVSGADSGVGVLGVVVAAVAVASAVASGSICPEACPVGATVVQAGTAAGRMTNVAIATASRVSCSTIWRFCVIIASLRWCCGPRGIWDNPLRLVKARACAARVLPARQIERLIETVENLEQAGDP